ncbi:MAG: pilus assembly protein, partial [Chloroflexota bacterium]|nr:pilus assembly protein [Chloroflexota bacterium]
MTSTGQAARGQALVEFALMIPIVLLFIVIAVDVGRSFASAVTLNNAARVGAQYVARNIDAWDPATYESQIQAEWATITDECAPGSIPAPSFPEGQELGDPVVVTLSCSYTPLTPGFVDMFADGLMLAGSATMPISSGEAGLPSQPPPPTFPIPAVPDYTGRPSSTVDACYQLVPDPPPPAEGYTIGGQDPPPGTYLQCGETVVVWGDNCVRQPPTLTADPLLQRAAQGQTRTYTARITNNDQGYCRARTIDFNVTKTGSKDGWTIGKPSSLTLYGGESGQSSFDITPATSVTAGLYDFSVGAADGIDTVNAAFQFDVVNCPQQPPTLTVAPGYPPDWHRGGSGEKRTYLVTVTNNDPPPSDPECGARAFTFTTDTVAPKPFPKRNDWSFAPPPSLTLAPGQTGEVAWDITAPASATAQNYDFRITTSGVSQTIRYEYVACATALPTLTVQPAKHTGGVGITRTYTVTLTNNDPTTCADRTFTYTTPVAPSSGWAYAPPPDVTIPAGTTIQRDWDITPLSAPTGVYNFTLAAGGTSAPVQYEVLGCVQAAPTLSVTPASHNGALGDTRSYTVTLTNNDSVACVDREFTFSALAGFSPSDGWSFAAPGPITLAAGASGDRVWDITPNDGSDGTYSFTISSGAASTTVEYVLTVVVPPTPTPTADPTPTPTADPTPTPTAA